jgi:hypothetical protein
MKSSASTEPYQSAFPWPHDPDPATDVHLASVITRCFVVADRDWEEHRPKIGDVPRSEVILNELHLYTRREDGGAAGALQTVEGASMLFDAGSPNLELWGTDNSVGLIVMILAIDPCFGVRFEANVDALHEIGRAHNFDDPQLFLAFEIPFAPIGSPVWGRLIWDLPEY